jgi:hypothetical protein
LGILTALKVKRSKSGGKLARVCCSAAEAEAMRRVLILLAVIAALTAVGLMPVWKMSDDGLWPLSVSIRSASGLPIAAATCEVFGSPEAARYTLENAIPAESGTYAAVADPFRGEAIEVRVPTAETTRGSLLWKSKSFYQYNTLVVIVRHPDGQREAVSATIPDVRQTRAVTVTVP